MQYSCLDYRSEWNINNRYKQMSYGTAEDVIGAFLRRKNNFEKCAAHNFKTQPNLLDDADEDNYYHLFKKNLEDFIIQIGYRLPETHTCL